MRGKSIDIDFVTNFIQECAATNKLSPQDVCDEALRKIEDIDKQLKLRIKLVDVLSFFNYKKKTTNIEKEISFANINKESAIKIFSYIANNIKIEELMKLYNVYQDNYKKELIFTTKQLLETKVIAKNSSEILVHGPNFKLFNESKNN
jgi:hypothetical protein